MPTLKIRGRNNVIQCRDGKKRDPIFDLKPENPDAIL